MSDHEGHYIYFFKVIVQRTLQDGDVMIPSKFVKRYGKELPSSVMLRIPNGAKWEVFLDKRDSNFWFKKGWERFAKECSLRYGNFLVFRCERGSRDFHVVIFDKSASEIDYPSVEETEGAEKHYEDVEILDESEVQRSPSSQPWKRMKTNCFRGPGRRSSYWSNIKNVAFYRANTFQSDNPFFHRPLTPSYVENQLAIPADFSKKYLRGLNGNATLTVDKDEEKRSWDVRFKYNDETNRTMMTSGWKQFVKENNLQAGDSCVFELINRSTFSFNIYVYSDREDQQQHCEQLQGEDANQLGQEQQNRGPEDHHKIWNGTTF